MRRPGSRSRPAYYARIRWAPKHVHAAFISFQPFMQVCLGREYQCAGTRAGIAPFGDSVMESSVAAEFAGTSIGDQIVGWTQNFEIVEVVEHGNPLAFEFPQNRR